MADLVWGQPLEGGESVPGPHSAWGYKVSADGTRRIEPYSISPGSGVWKTGLSLRTTELVPDEAAGFIPSAAGLTSEGYLTRVSSLTAEQGAAGWYVRFANAVGSCYVAPGGATPAPATIASVESWQTIATATVWSTIPA